ncbi:hypothetical protein [Streptodolium elevatio]|uniref:Terminase small subunit n=1 Tax=Streptodolium elevatio TaxID=3157996 RepID=A0ABV3DLF4_9ACTN
MMPGRGPAPKDPKKRARTNADPIPQTVLRFEHADPPPLPDDLACRPMVVRWWDTWVSSPQAEHFSSTDWLFLVDTAYIAKAFYDGDLKQAPELRLRVAKLGATMEDRARLRLVFAEADEKDAKRPAAAPSRERYADLRVLPGAGASGAVAGA